MKKIIIVLVFLSIFSGILCARLITSSSNSNESNKNTSDNSNTSNTNDEQDANTNSDDEEKSDDSNTISNNTEESDISNTSSDDKESDSSDKDYDKDKNKESDDKYSSNDIFGKNYSKADELMKTMTLEEKVGQMFYARYPTDNKANDEIKNNNPGGYILFGVNFKNQTPKSITNMINNNQKNSKVKMLIGVDEEGGTVTRVSLYSAFRKTKFKSPQELWKEGQLPKILTDSTEKSKLLKSLGINMNLTPVVDVPLKSSSFIFARSYGRGAEKTATYTASLINTMNKDNMISSMKHFPGYGDNVDTHTGIAIDERPYSTFEKSDFLPFISGIKSGAPTILVSHNIVKCMDKKLPASLSPDVHKVLRENLSFSGLIITDDLAMDAVKKYVENGEAAVQAVLAGNDLIISSSFVKQKNEVINAVKSKKISEDTINTAVRRILACKLYYGII